MVLGSSHSPSLFCAGVIASAHGVQGHVKVKCFLEDPSVFKTYSPFCNEEGNEIYKINKIFSQNKDVLIVSLDGVRDRTEAERLKGEKLMCSRGRLPELSNDVFYHADLIGLSVNCPNGQSLGRVYAIYNFGAGDILEVEILQGKLEMIPFTHAVVPEVNIKEGFICLSKEGELLLKGGSSGS